MKKTLLTIFALVAAGAVGTASAQVNPIENLPNEKGQTIVNKCYDGEGNLRATMRYEIAEYDADDFTGDLKVIFTMTDADGNVIDYGTIDAFYDGEKLDLRMSNRPQIDGIADYLSMNTKLLNDFLNYPGVPEQDRPSILPHDPFEFEAANYVIRTSERPRDFVRVKVTDREYVGDEMVAVPAGEFNTKKVKFLLEMYDHDTRERKQYLGTEWFAPGEGIVKTEITDGQGRLVDHSHVVDIYNSI